MAAFRRLVLRFVNAFRPNRAETDLQREVASHLALLEDEYRRRGMSAEQAHTEARKAIGGGAEQAKIRHRDARSFVWLDELRTDVKYAVRRLRGRPGASVLAIAMLAIAVGLSTAMFTIVDALIVRPLPFPHAERLIGLYMGNDRGGRPLLPQIFVAWRDSSIFERVEGWTSGSVVVEANGGPVARPGAVVTPGLFDMLGARPLFGRLFQTEAAELDAVLLSETLWRTAFQADRSLVGREIRLDGQRVVVIGIMPEAFRFPEWNTDVWRARHVRASDTERTWAVVRLSTDIPEVDALGAATALSHATDASTESLYARKDPLVGTSDTYYQRAVPFLAGAVTLVALVLCANVSSLLLTRLRARRREFGVCAALGASRGRLLRQAVVESVTIGVSGAAVGLALAWALVSIAGAVLPQAFLANSLNPVALDLRALLVAAAVGVLVTCAAGVIPAWVGTSVGRRAVSHPLADRGGTDTKAGRVTVRGLLIAEVALACALLVGATLLVRSFVNVSRIDRGFDPEGMVTLTFSFDDTGIDSPEARAAARAEIQSAMQALPGVTGAAWSTGQGIYFGESVSDLPDVGGIRVVAETIAIGPEYFDLYRIQLLRGRGFTADDRDDVAIVGERFAAALWPGVDPLGRTFQRYGTWTRVVGVTRETLQALVNANSEYAGIFTPFGGGGRYPILNVRCDAVCPSEGVFRHAAMTAGLVSLSQVAYLDQDFARDLEQPRASAALAGTFALVALIASAVGLFGVLSYAVQERRREFGIRAAIGATPAAIAKVVFREGAIVGSAGLLIGTALAAALASTLASLSYQVTAFDPLSVAAIVVTLVLTMVLALWRPARTAARTDPALLLKEE